MQKRTQAFRHEAWQDDIVDWKDCTHLRIRQAGTRDGFTVSANAESIVQWPHDRDRQAEYPSLATVTPTLTFSTCKGKPVVVNR